MQAVLFQPVQLQAFSAMDISNHSHLIIPIICSDWIKVFDQHLNISFYNKLYFIKWSIHFRLSQLTLRMLIACDLESGHFDLSFFACCASMSTLNAARCLILWPLSHFLFSPHKSVTKHTTKKIVKNRGKTLRQVRGIKYLNQMSTYHLACRDIEIT